MRRAEIVNDGCVLDLLKQLRSIEGLAMLADFTPDDLRRIGIPIAIVVGTCIGLWLMQRQKQVK